jgi:hypothetical protein
MPADWCRLEVTLGQKTWHNDGRRAAPGSRVPLNTTADDLMRQIHGTANHAATIVANTLHTEWRYRRATGRPQDYRTITRAVALVAPNIDRLTTTLDGIAVALHAAHLHRQVVHQLGHTRQREHKHLPCPRCGAQSLVREIQDRRHYSSNTDGSATPEVVRCLACDGKWSETDYSWLATMVLAEQEEHAVLKYLLAERDWALTILAHELGLPSVEALLDRLRTAQHVHV